MKFVANGLLRLLGWRLVFVPPPGSRAMIMFYPHTSNWDFFFGVLARSAMDLPMKYAAKDSLFRWPWGIFFRALGGIPVNRRERTGFVGQMVAQFNERPRFFLTIAPEGTRKATDGLKSGFYHVALAAGVPVGLGFIDYSRRQVGIAGYVDLSGNEENDLAQLAHAYRSFCGKHVHQQAPFCFPSRKA